MTQEYQQIRETTYKQPTEAGRHIEMLQNFRQLCWVDIAGLMTEDALLAAVIQKFNIF